MAYIKQTWVNNPPSTATPINATRLNHLETQYDEALAQVAADIADPDSDIGTELTATIGDVSAVEMSNPETALNSATVSLVQDTVGTSGSIPQINDARDNPSKARIGGGPQIWLIDDGGADPVLVQDGDIILPVASEPAPWSPTQIPGLAVFLDAQSLALSDGAGVTEWPNLATGKPSFTGSGDATLDADGLNGLPAVVFNGTAGVLTSDAFESYTGVLTVYVAAQSTIGTPAGTDCIFDALDGVTPLRGGLARNASNEWAVYRGTNFTVAGADTAAHIFKVEYRMDASSTLYVDGASTGSGATQNSIPSTKYVIGGRGDGNASNTHVGPIAAYVVVRGTVSESDDTALHAWLGDRYGF